MVTDTFSSATNLLLDLGENIFLLSFSFSFVLFFNHNLLDYKTVIPLNSFYYMFVKTLVEQQPILTVASKQSLTMIKV